MLSYVGTIFSENGAHFGFLKFVYPDDVTKKTNDKRKSTDDADKNDRLSSVSHCGICAAFAKSIINSLFGSS
jgi:hypothetical protein